MHEAEKTQLFLEQEFPRGENDVVDTLSPPIMVQLKEFALKRERHTAEEKQLISKLLRRLVKLLGKKQTEIALHLGIRVQSFHSWIKEGRLPFSRIELLETFVNEHLNQKQREVEQLVSDLVGDLQGAVSVSEPSGSKEDPYESMVISLEEPLPKDYLAVLQQDPNPTWSKLLLLWRLDQERNNK
jgi:hypothetical protein